MYFLSDKVRTANFMPGSVFVNDKPLNIVHEQKYLGHILNDNFDDTSDLKAQLRNFYGRSNMFIRKFYSCSNAVKNVLFNAFCSNIYCSSLWYTYRVSDIEKFRVAYNNAFRKLHHLPMSCSASEMFVFNRVNSFVHIRRKSINSLANRIRNSTNLLVNACYRLKFYHAYDSDFWTMYRFLLFNDK